MKSLMICLLMLAPLAVFAQDNPGTQQSVATVNGDQLKSWYDQKKPMVVLDARTKEYFDGKLLPDAKWLPYNSSEDAIRAAAPSKDGLIVVYCWGPECPASGMLAHKLQSMGYTNIYEYRGGVQEWKQKGYPIDQK
ncbi:rhodanese-like domain-containing protein [Chlamydiota bacterium]